MASIHDILKEDDVNGQIIGGFVVVGFLTYEGRRQTQDFYADTEELLKVAANDRLAERREEIGETYSLIYPNKNGWSLKVVS